MHTIQDIGTNTILLYPENGTEFSRENLIAFARLSFLYQCKKLTFHQLKVQLVYEFLNLNRIADTSKSENEQLIENINEISKLNNGFFINPMETDGVINRAKMDFFMQRIPDIKVNSITFYGPQDALMNTVYGEYLQLLTHLSAFGRTADISELDKLIATIYRPKKPNYDEAKEQPDFDGDIRVEFNPNHTDTYAKQIANLGFDVKYAIFLFVASCQYFIANNHHLDIGNDNYIDLTLLFSQEPTDNSKEGLGMVGTLYNLAETNVFGDVRNVAKTNTYDILAFLVNQKMEYNKLKKQSNAVT